MFFFVHGNEGGKHTAQKWEAVLEGENSNRDEIRVEPNKTNDQKIELTSNKLDLLTSSQKYQNHFFSTWDRL